MVLKKSHGKKMMLFEKKERQKALIEMSISLTEAIEALSKAILLDCEETLANPENEFTEKSQNDDCQCFNNLNVAIRIMKSEPTKAERYIELIESHIKDTRRMLKPCKHNWSTVRMRAAAWDVIDAKAK